MQWFVRRKAFRAASPINEHLDIELIHSLMQKMFEPRRVGYIEIGFHPEFRFAMLLQQTSRRTRSACQSSHHAANGDFGIEIIMHDPIPDEVTCLLLHCCQPRRQSRT